MKGNIKEGAELLKEVAFKEQQYLPAALVLGKEHGSHPQPRVLISRQGVVFGAGARGGSSIEPRSRVPGSDELCP